VWVVVGGLLGLMVLLSVLGFHAGPHAHLVAAVLGIVLSGWLLVMVVEGRSTSVLLVLVGVVLAVSTGIASLAWKGLSTRPLPGSGIRRHDIEGAEGTAITDLSPEGIVRVNGESWSAESLSGPVRAGARVHVVTTQGVRLGVWGD